MNATIKNGIEVNNAKISEIKDKIKTANVASGIESLPEAIGLFCFAGCFLSSG